MKDEDVEALLARYRPVARTPGLPRPARERTWPWAVSAAALLGISVGLHAIAAGPPPHAPLDETRVRALTEQMGGTADSRAVAEWVVREQQRADERDAPSWAALLAPAVAQ